ncbi:MAG TPA: penicillin acylase family protein [Acidimicrobiales bacterium]|nr:penicillin acylase family protein [Acidimicrobiales bacterium]
MLRLAAGMAVAALLVPTTQPAGALLGGLLGTDGHYRDFGDRGGFSNILPPGQDGSLNTVEALAAQAGVLPAHTKDQYGPYHDLVRAVPGLTEDRLGQFYKDASFGVAQADIERSYSPFPNVTVVRDKRAGVAHIFGTTRYATMAAEGYTSAEDRLFAMDVLRHVGRARLSELLGPSAANQALDRNQLAVAPYTEADLTAQVAAIGAGGPEGAQIANDLKAYADGVNAYIAQALLDPLKLPAEYPALQQVPRSWTPEDSVAVASYVGGRLGKGGGSELANLCGLKVTAAELGSATAARQVFDDLHLADDPETPTTSTKPAPYPTGLGPVDQASQPDVDCSSLRLIDGSTPSLQDLLDATRGILPTLPGSPGQVASSVLGLFRLDFPHSLSNALLVSAAKSAGGRPVAVFGPQTGYFMPQPLLEKDVHGPGISARGVGFAGADLYVQMGRGAGYAWSATSSGADNVDQVVLRLCDPAGGPATVTSMGEVRNGTCVPLQSFEHVQVAKPTLAGLPDGPDLVLDWPVQRSAASGPLVARGRLSDGTPVAVANHRSTYGAELASAAGFKRLNDPAYVTGFSSFRQAVAGIDYTFNWFYVDDHDIGYQHSCKCPQRAAGVDPDLPAWGTGQWDWQGFVPRSSEPWDLNPATGWISSWNNTPAPGFRAADDSWNLGAVHRVQLLNRRIQAAIAAGPVTRSALVNAMGDAGTVDLRGEADLGVLLDALGPTPPAGLDPRVGELRSRLAAWAASPHRRDLDGDGAYDDPVAPAVMDAWWPRLVAAVFDASSGHALGHLGVHVHDPPQGHLGSAFDGGVYSQVQHDLRQVLGQPVAAPWSRTYCGAGAGLAACRQALWQSLSDAAGALQAEFGSASVGDWKRTVADDQIEYSVLGLTTMAPAPWINRPTFQQVVEVGAS